MVRLTANPDAVQGGSLGPALFSLHPAAPSNKGRARRGSRFRNMVSLREFAGESQAEPQADRPHHLMYPHHRHGQRFERHSPLRKRTPREDGEAERDARLRDKPQPAVARKGRYHWGRAAGPDRAEPQRHRPQGHEQHDPGPELRQDAGLEPGAREREEYHGNRQRASSQLSPEALAFDRREVLDDEP